MISRQYIGERFKSVDEQDAEVTKWQSKYGALIDTLGKTGTEVLRRRTLEVDMNIPPEFFVGRAVHEFVFPPQSVTLVADESRPTEGTVTNRTTIEDKLYGYDENQVLGRIRITYDDADSKIQFAIIDPMESSVLDEHTEAALKPFESITSPIR